MIEHLQNNARASIFFAWVVAALLLPGAAWAGDPAISYRTIRTKHFHIHYDAPLEPFAQQVAITAENSYLQLTTSLGWHIEGIVQVRIVDSTDYANGMASAYRYPFIELYATPPDIDSSMQYHDDWLSFLVTHELTHVAHLQMQYGVSRIYNSIFGDLYLPNSMQPTWFVEGLAVLMETVHTKRGRIRSPYYRMVTRTHALEGNFLNLGQASNTTSAYPRGDADYIYGAMFLSYLAERFGVETVFSIAHRYAAQPIPYGLNRVFSEVTGTPLDRLYAEWTQQVHKSAVDTNAQIDAVGRTDSERLTYSGETKGHAILSADESALILPLRDGQERSALVEFPLVPNAAGAAQRRLALAGTDASISMNARGDLYYVRTAPFKDNYRYRDLFVLRAGETEPERLTVGMRIKEGEVSRSGEQVVVVTNRLGQTQLELLSPEGKAGRVLLPPKDGVQYYCPTFSPDGKQVAFVIRQGTRLDVALVNVQSGRWYYVTADDGVEQSLRFSVDGRYLLFESDVNGIWNIYARETNSGQLKQLTQVTTGANHPVLSRDNRTLYFLQYYSEGWDLHRTTVSIDDLPPFMPPSFTPVVANEKIAVSSEKTSYNPLPSFRPHAWEVGFMGMGTERTIHLATYWEDAALLHLMSVGFDYEFSERNPSVSVLYSYTGLLPQFQLQFSYSTMEVPDGYLVNGVPSSWTKENYTGNVGFTFPLLGLDDNHYLSLSYTLNESAPVEKLPVTVDPAGDLPEMPTQYFRTGVRVSWSYSDIYNGPLAISREDGRSLYAGMTLYHPALGGTREQIAFSWNWREYRLAPWKHHHVFALGLGGEVYISNPNHLSGISAGGYSSQPLLDAAINQQSMGLPRIRGYVSNSISGDHYQSLRLEYRFPIWRPEVAYKTLPVFFRNVYGAVFSDHLLMSYNHFDMEDYYTSVGAELVWAFYLGYHMPLTLRAGFAKGFMDHGTNEFILVIGGTY